jgi:phosphoribosylaminoimidazole-succinocarboxamide synthase
LELRKGKVLKDGKTKRVYSTQAEDQLILSFKDTVRFFDGGESVAFRNKGRYAAAVSTALFRLLDNYHIATHFVQPLKANELAVQKMDMFPLQVVVWNYGSSHFSKRYGTEKGKPLDFPVIELFWKNEKLHNPLIGADHAIAFSLAKEFEINELVQISRKTNAVLKSFFERRSLILADFQLEFGRTDRGILIGDEMTLDTCRLWHLQNGEIDFNRFRLDRGPVAKTYVDLYEQIGIQP